MYREHAGRGLQIRTPPGHASDQRPDHGGHRDLDRPLPGSERGPVIPGGEALSAIESAKGNNGYYLVSDRDIHPYRLRIRTPSFAAMQMLPLMVRGHMIPDLLAVLGAMDYVLSDVDR